MLDRFCYGNSYMPKENQKYSLWIEAECWMPGTWKPDDTDSDVIIEWENGERWVASFMTYKHVKTITEKNKKTGECLSGAYFWTSDMILIDEVSRHRIEEVILDLIHVGYFESVFTRLPNQEGGSWIRGVTNINQPCTLSRSSS